MSFGPYPARVLDWHDGDTCHMNIDLGFGVVLAAYDVKGRPLLSCRTAGINAPELSTPQGAPAREYAEGLCPPGTVVMLTSRNWDKYGGRYDGTLLLPDGRDFAAAMLEAGQAREYRL